MTLNLISRDMPKYTDEQLEGIADQILEARAFCNRISKTGFGKVPETTFDNLIINQFFNTTKIKNDECGNKI